MRLERQFHNIESMPSKNCISLLSDIAERANEVVPMQHGRGVNLRFVVDTQIRVTHGALPLRG